MCVWVEKIIAILNVRVQYCVCVFSKTQIRENFLKTYRSAHARYAR